MLAKNQYGVMAILYMVKNNLIFPAEKLPKRLSLFSNVFYIAIPGF